MLRAFWVFVVTADFKTIADLPLARIKRIMKSDEDVRMISAEAPVLFAKACELFILDLTMRCVRVLSIEMGGWFISYTVFCFVCSPLQLHAAELPVSHPSLHRPPAGRGSSRARTRPAASAC